MSRNERRKEVSIEFKMFMMVYIENIDEERWRDETNEER